MRDERDERERRDGGRGCEMRDVRNEIRDIPDPESRIPDHASRNSGEKYRCQEPFPELTVASCGARMDRPARTLSGSLMPRVLSHAYVWVPILAPDTFSCLVKRAL